MAEAKKYLHAKFRIDKRINAPDAYLFSENKERVDEWQAQKEEDTPQETAPSAPEQTFPALSNAFESSIEEFQETVPFIMGMMRLS